MTEKPDTTKPFLLRRENRYLWFALILPAYLLVFAWVEAVIPVEACRPTYIPLDDRIPFWRGSSSPTCCGSPCCWPWGCTWRGMTTRASSGT